MKRNVIESNAGKKRIKLEEMSPWTCGASKTAKENLRKEVSFLNKLLSFNSKIYKY